ncbi:MAG: acyl-CoA thioesterase [Sphingomonadaceae bacterium]|nr:acyl-CoA thioesterase [Sphingomonadaceae bacterium]
MPKPDPFLLEPGRYPLHVEIGLRFSDLDVNRHLNNVSLVDILQEGRGQFHRASGMNQTTSTFAWMVANLSVQFVGEAFHGTPVVCHTGLLSLGRTSQTIAQLAMQDGKAVAYAETVMVTMAHGKPAPHASDYCEQIEPWLIAR